ncbi:MAG TPA: DNA replication and repair protein RecF, partial [Puia sp.]
ESQLLHTPFRQLLRQGLEKDLYLQRTGSGVHRDDIDIRYADEPFKGRASQGQRKSLLFALKLAEYETLKQSRGWAPLLLLDDVFEKLDRHRMRNLLDRVCVKDEGQLFITDTHPERIRREMEEIGMDFQLIQLPVTGEST